ncbi:MAG TPA: NAD(P)/FAD-dependent oxidoreductase [Pyrinomonadaceae bacterium]
MEFFDTVIVGAGLAGLQCARLLSSAGLKVLLVDRKNSLTNAIHTTGIFVRKTLEDFEIPEHCLGSPVRQVTLYSPSLRPIKFVSKHDEFRIGRMGMLYEHYLNQCIHSGVTWRSGTGYVNHSVQRSGLLTVKLTCGQEIHSVATRYLIGADGARSRVALDLNLELNRHWIVGVEKVFKNVRFSGPPRLMCFLDPELAPGYIGWIAYDGEEAHVGVGGYPVRFDPLRALSKFQLKVSQIVDLSRAEQLEQRGGLIPVGGVLRRIVNQHGMLVGDAAGAVSPLTAGGLDPCMRLSSLAANVVVEFLQSRDPSVLERYSGKRFRARFASRLCARRLAAALDQRQIVELTVLALRLPLMNIVARHIFFGRGSFPDVEMEMMPHLVAD